MNRPLPGKQCIIIVYRREKHIHIADASTLLQHRKLSQGRNQASQIRVKYFFNALFQDRYCFCLR